MSTVFAHEQNLVSPEQEISKKSLIINDSTTKSSTGSFNFTLKEKQWLDEHPVIKIGIDQSFAPYEWIDNDGNYIGLAADYIQLLQERLGVRFEIIRKNSWNEVLDLARKNQLDMLSIAIKTDDRDKFLTFSKPYVSSAAVIINRVSQGYVGGLDKLAGKKIAIQKGHYTEELISKYYPNIVIATANNLINALTMVSEGKAYAYVGEVMTANYAMKKAGLANLRFAGQTQYKSEFSFAFSKNHPELAAIVSKAMLGISEKEKNRIFERWHSLEVNLGVSPETRTYYILVASGVLFLILFWVYRLRKEIKKRKITEISLKLAATVYDNTSEAMIVTDSNNMIIAVNPAFTEVTGFTQTDVYMKPPTILRPKKQDKGVCGAMCKAIDETGYWQGELWSKRKNGEEFIEWVTINTIYDNEGRVSERVTLFSDITERKEAEKLIHIQAHYDALTKSPNRLMFIDRLEQEIKKSDRNNQSFALLFLDLDNFKEVNDCFGHHVGDQLLVETARRLNECVRRSDTVARLGGDEFTVILPETSDLLGLERIVQNILVSLAEPYVFEESQSYVSASIGITLYPADGDTLETLLKNADMAMYRAKELGKNRFSYFTSSMQDAVKQHLELLADLRKAINDEQFVLFYQPVIDLVTGEIIQAEALIRWNHPTRGIIKPSDFIYLAEESALIVDIGNWVFCEAARQVKKWQQRFSCSFRISINKSPIQFRADDKQCDWPQYLKELDISNDAIIIEVTEALLMNEEPNIQRNLMALKDAGLHIAIDDFGTGHISLSNLNDLNVDYLKIDKSFVENLSEKSADQALSEAIIVMAHKLGLKVIAEGIETKLQQKMLMAAGCDFGQGFLFSKPVTAEEFEALYNKASINE